MALSCLFGKHHYGLARLDALGRLTRECLRCMRVEHAGSGLLPNGAAAALEVRRARAIAELVARDRWVGLPANARRASPKSEPEAE